MQVKHNEYDPNSDALMIEENRRMRMYTAILTMSYSHYVVNISSTVESAAKTTFLEQNL